VKVRGITVLTRKMIVTRRFGAEAWARLYRDVAAAHHCFRSLVTTDSLLPLPAYLAFHDELVRRFFADDEQSHLQLGRESARWALVDGPFKTFMQTRGLAGFVASFPELWRLYFAETTSWSEATLSGDQVEFKAFGLPQWHPYFEHFIVGYMSEVLELFCANPMAATRIRGGGGMDYHYLLHRAPAAAEGDHDAGGDDLVARGRRLRTREAERYLSNREIEALLLVAQGKTNKEIGCALGISGKTAQHHVARAYSKIGVSGRVGATVWLAERGLVGK
jgi:DNA-binding CsgD family transcriptional regulator